MASVTFDHVEKSFGDFAAVNDLNIQIAGQGIPGPGWAIRLRKNNALRCLAGLEEVSGGQIMIGDQVVNDVAPKDRDIAMVFQSYALYPHMSVFDNMAFGLKLRKVPKDEIKRRVEEAAEILGIEATAQAQAPRTFRRPTPACGSRPRHRARAQSFPLRRTALQPGCQTARSNPRRDQQTAPASADHLHLRDPRPDGSHDHGHPHRGHEQRYSCSNWIHRRHLYDQPSQPVRGWLHRIARHELLPGQDSQGWQSLLVDTGDFARSKSRKIGCTLLCTCAGKECHLWHPPGRYPQPDFVPSGYSCCTGRSQSGCHRLMGNEIFLYLVSGKIIMSPGLIPAPFQLAR